MRYNTIQYDKIHYTLVLHASQWSTVECARNMHKPLGECAWEENTTSDMFHGIRWKSIQKFLYPKPWKLTEIFGRARKSLEIFAILLKWSKVFMIIELFEYLRKLSEIINILADVIGTVRKHSLASIKSVAWLHSTNQNAQNGLGELCTLSVYV